MLIYGEIHLKIYFRFYRALAVYPPSNANFSPLCHNSKAETASLTQFLQSRWKFQAYCKTGTEYKIKVVI